MADITDDQSLQEPQLLGLNNTRFKCHWLDNCRFKVYTTAVAKSKRIIAGSSEAKIAEEKKYESTSLGRKKKSRKEIHLHLSPLSSPYGICQLKDAEEKRQWKVQHQSNHKPWARQSRDNQEILGSASVQTLIANEKQRLLQQGTPCLDLLETYRPIFMPCSKYITCHFICKKPTTSSSDCDGKRSAMSAAHPSLVQTNQDFIKTNVFFYDTVILQVYS